jgi:hypothetical protein
LILEVTSTLLEGKLELQKKRKKRRRTDKSALPRAHQNVFTAAHTTYPERNKERKKAIVKHCYL